MWQILKNVLLYLVERSLDSHMSELFDLSNFDKYKEDNCLEVKKADFLYHYGSRTLHLRILMAE